MSELKYGEDVPTESGWYWRRSMDNERIMFLSVHSRPTHWRTIKQETMETLNTPSYREELESKPDSFWIVEWAGPLQPPK